MKFEVYRYLKIYTKVNEDTTSVVHN